MQGMIVWLNENIVWRTRLHWVPELAPDGPRYRALANAIERAIEAGELHVGDRLPPQRDLAWRIGLDTSTVNKAYREAARRHLIHGEVGRGTFVLGRSRASDLFVSHRQDPTILDLSVNVPVPRPAQEFKAAVQSALEISDTDWQGYAPQKLIQRLRIAGAKWLAMRGINARPQEVVPVAGGQSALAAILSVLDIKALGIEERTYSGVLALARAHALTTVDLSMDDAGVLPNALADAKVDAAILVPTLHNPTGRIWPEARRRALLAAAARSGTLLIEDDAYGPLSDASPLAVLNSDARLLFVSTLSKTVAAGLRVGFVWGRGDVIEKLDAAVYATSWAVAPLMMEVATRWIEDDVARERVAWQRQEIEARHRLAETIFPQLRGTPPSPHIFIDTDAPPELFEEAGVRVASSPAFSRRPEVHPGIRISLSAAPSRVDLDIALAACARIIRAFVPG